MIGIGIGIPFIRVSRGAAIDAQAVIAYNRIIADGGLVQGGLMGLSSLFTGLKAIYGVTDIADAVKFLGIPNLGVQLGTGSGTTAGQAASKLYNLVGGSILGAAPNMYYTGNGAAGNNISTPSAPANEITGDIEYVIKCSFSATNENVGLNKSSLTATSMGASIQINSTALYFYYAIGSTLYETSFGNSTFPALNTVAYIKVTRVSSTGVVSASWGTDGVSFPNTMGSAIGQTGAINAGAVSLKASTTELTGSPQGKTYYATISPTIGGQPTVIFNPNLYTGANTFSSGGATWTVNKTNAGLTDAIQASIGAQPLLLLHDGVSNYWFAPRVDGNNVTTPSTSAINSDLDFKACINSRGSENDRTIIGEGDTAIGYSFAVNNTNNLYLYLDTPYTSTATIPSGKLWVRVLYYRSSGNIVFYTSTDPIATNPNAVNWTQLGAVVSGPVNYIASAIGAVTIGKYSAYTGNSFNGYIYRATRSNSIDGAFVYDFNPNTYNAATSQTQWTSATGEVWTINTDSNASGFVGTLVDDTTLAFGGTSEGKQLQATAFTISQPDTVYTCYKYDAFNDYQGVYDSVGGGGQQTLNNSASSATSEIFAGAALTFNINQSKKRINTAIYNNTNSVALEDNIQVASGTVGAQNLNGLRIGVLLNSPPAYSLKGKVNTLLFSPQADTTTQRTAVYNLLKTLNKL